MIPEKRTGSPTQENQAENKILLIRASIDDGFPNVLLPMKGKQNSIPRNLKTMKPDTSRAKKKA